MNGGWLISTFKAGLAIAVVMLSTLLSGHGAGAASSGRIDSVAKFDHASTAAQFPLWKDIPVKTFAVLATGNVHGSEWAAYGFRGSGGRNRPCVDIARITASGAYSYSIECGSLAPDAGASEPPVYALISGTGRKSVDSRPLAESFLSMSLAEKVKKVHLTLRGGASIVRGTKTISTQQGRKAHVARFSYLALGLTRSLYICHVVGWNADGEKILDASTAEC